MNNLAKDIKDLMDAVKTIWSKIKNVVKEIYKTIQKRNKQDKTKQGWYVPMNTCKEHQVMSKRIIVPHVRSR